MTDLIFAAILIAIIGGAALYIYKAKKRGVKCIGCPAAGSCSRNCSGASACGCGDGANSCSCHTDSN